MIEIVGWLGGVAFAVSSLPAAFSVYKRGNTEGMDSLFLHLWAWGEILTLSYVLIKAPEWPLLFNYGVNLIGLSVIFWFKTFPRNKA
jgi:uncharacterized protein with PQ loop repeat